MASVYRVRSAEGQRAPYGTLRPEEAAQLIEERMTLARQNLSKIESQRLAEDGKVIAVTHNGKFHADEVMATAVLKKVYANRGQSLEVVRSRDLVTIASADIVYDVGGVYDHERRRYDHHQLGALKRENGLTRSALGLIWLHYGLEYCEGNERAAAKIDNVLVRGIDARDNGELKAPEDPEARNFGISEDIELYNPIIEQGETYDDQFVKAVGYAAERLARLYDKVLVEIRTEDAIAAARAESGDERYAVMDHQVVPPDILSTWDGFEYLVFPEYTNNTWQIYAMRTPEDPFVSKRPFPKAWAGLMNDELAKMTGVDDALFCHVKRFLTVAKTREGALALLSQALEQSERRDS